ncbi:phospholipase D-like domain-containing protein [Halomonas binhaiensis]|uniref:PLD phosphodiesterase domain-containing protein n=1 Tax=Halomonas binhaiensis TaxID=2562282 RepID=A0A5C1NHG0_9GAMM|nr:phospholipase D-like domain-containing protein [Halomonas binhaiensis]QEM82694.1 hypothetical protein E4T21_14915 [Halomonas binhaiensis]
MSTSPLEPPILGTLLDFGDISARTLQALNALHLRSSFDIHSVARMGHIPRDQHRVIAHILEILIKANLLEPLSGERYRCKREIDYAYLSGIIDGAMAGLRRGTCNEPKMILTLGHHAIHLQAAAHAQGLRPNFETTGDLINHLAVRSQKQLTLVTPFYDHQGLAFLEKLVRDILPEQAEIRLITRRWEEKPLETWLADRPEISRRVAYRYYRKALEDNRYETSHAKLILADDTQAYVGSANLTAASLELSNELGLWVQGDIARVLYRLSQALWNAAT